MTPDGEDSPKWSETVAARMEDKMPIKQPDFEAQETPAKKKKFDHEVESGITPPEKDLPPGPDRDRLQAILRGSKGWEDSHPGVPGKTSDDAVDVEEYDFNPDFCG